MDYGAEGLKTNKKMALARGIERTFVIHSAWIRTGLYAGVFILFLLGLAESQADNRNVYPLPEERGTAGIMSALEKLPVYARVLHVTAHPDDESAGTLTWLSRKFHAQTALFCLTRGEGGQNILGNEKYESMGLVRTGELLEACKYYGVDLYFASVLDFGFSKTSEETFSKWDHEATLEEMVRFIRRWHPEIIISRFQGNSGDGHGHHQAAGILVHEALRAAADARKYPAQLAAGLQSWQVKKLYVSHSGGEFGRRGTGSNDWTVRVPVGDYDPVLGRSYREIGIEGYSKHRSQGNGAVFATSAPAYEYFKLVDSSVGIKPKESNLFDSIDTSLMGIFNLAGSEQGAVEFLRQDLAGAEKAATEALAAFEISSPEKSAAAVARGIRILNGSIHQVANSSLSAPRKALLSDALKAKLHDFHDALSAVLGIYFTVRSNNATNVPGGTESVTAYFFNRGNTSVYIKQIGLNTSGKFIAPMDANSPLGDLTARNMATYRFSVEIPQDAKVTEPFWYLESSRDTRYKLQATEDEFAPFGKPEIVAQATYVFQNTEVPIHAALMAQSGDPLRGADFEEFQIVPALSLTLDPEYTIAPIRPTDREYEFRISVLNNQEGDIGGTLKLVSAEGWRVRPAEMQFALSRKGETFTTNFWIQVPAGTKTGNYPVEAFANTGGKEFRRGYKVISYPENWTRNIYRPARSELVIFEIETAPNLTVGYIPGAGDDIPNALEQLGIEVRTLTAFDLAFGNLSRFSAIVTGVRAYNVNEDLRASNQRLLDYVAQGGTLIVQYVRPMGGRTFGGDGFQFPFGPYPMTNSNSDRITVEESPIRILDPTNPIFNTPNRISLDDFDGWVQERGLYFMNSWDSGYSALLSGNDPGEEPKSGGMLMTQYGKGYYIYTAYAWFRQLPAAVPGAFRIFANMISLGH